MLTDSSMPKLPVFQDKDIIHLLKRLGFNDVRQKGSHRIFKHPDGRRTIVPIHPGHDIPSGTLKAMLRDINLDLRDLEK